MLIFLCFIVQNTRGRPVEVVSNAAIELKAEDTNEELFDVTSLFADDSWYVLNKKIYLMKMQITLQLKFQGDHTQNITQMTWLGSVRGHVLVCKLTECFLFYDWQYNSCVVEEGSESWRIPTPANTAPEQTTAGNGRPGEETVRRGTWYRERGTDWLGGSVCQGQIRP